MELNAKRIRALYVSIKVVILVFASLISILNPSFLYQITHVNYSQLQVNPDTGRSGTPRDPFKPKSMNFTPVNPDSAASGRFYLVPSVSGLAGVDCSSSLSHVLAQGEKSSIVQLVKFLKFVADFRSDNHRR